MENTQKQKTPEQWFQALKEPYRSEAIANIVDNRPVLSLNSALECQNAWKLTPQGFEYWNKIAVSIKAGETNYLEPETLKPEQMESGKWYVIETNFRYLAQFDKIEDNAVVVLKYYYYGDGGKIKSYARLCNFEVIKSIRPATKDEVLKYFPDEVFEPIELRSEDLVSCEVYKNVVKYNDGDICYYIYKFISLNGDDAKYSKMINYKGDVFYNDTVCLKSNVENIEEKKIYHATPEEKALLLGEEETDWEAKYKELENVVYEQSKLIKRLQNELQEPKGEKVYFFADIEEKIWGKVTDKLVAIEFSRDNYEIYEAVCIGKKKSVLVNE